MSFPLKVGGVNDQWLVFTSSTYGTYRCEQDLYLPFRGKTYTFWWTYTWFQEVVEILMFRWMRRFKKKTLLFFTFTGPSIGIALVPYYRQLLPMLNLYKQRRVNIGDHIDFRGGRRIGDVVNATLELLEQCGGPDAYLNIKYMVPTYESCVYNR